jgi:hypothetical protein
MAKIDKEQLEKLKKQKEAKKLNNEIIQKNEQVRDSKLSK